MGKHFLLVGFMGLLSEIFTQTHSHSRVQGHLIVGVLEIRQNHPVGIIYMKCAFELCEGATLEHQL